MKKALKIVGGIFAVIFVAAVLFLIYTRIQINNGNLVKWEGKWYTKEQLNKKFPPQYIEVPAKNTPEEVYAKFREALLKNNLEGVLELMTPEKRMVYREIFESKNLLELGNEYPKIINKDNISGNFSTYSYKFNKEGREIFSSVKFIKNYEGYWQIDAI